MDPFIGEIKIFGGTYAPQGWAFCDGSTVQINDNQELYALIGTTYGGTATTFNLPDLRGRVPIHFSGSNLGEVGGVETVTLLPPHIAAHTHTLYADNTAANDTKPLGNLLGQPATLTPYAAGSPNTSMASSAITATTGTALPHDNVMPYLCINYIIALVGIWPSQN